MSTWDTDSSPFGVEPIDGIVYADDDISPELRAPAGPLAPPPPPPRPAPRPPVRRRVGEWHPGGRVEPAPLTSPPARPSLIRTTIIGLLPIAMAVAVVAGVMRAYNMITF